MQMPSRLSPPNEKQRNIMENYPNYHCLASSSPPSTIYTQLSLGISETMTLKNSMVRNEINEKATQLAIQKKKSPSTGLVIEFVVAF